MSRRFGEDMTGRLALRCSTVTLEGLHRRLKFRQAREPDLVLSDLIREALDAYLATPAPGAPKSRRRPQPPPIESSTSERHSLPHLVAPDGSCAGGCDVDVDTTCTVGPDDPRRTGKRKRR